MKGNEVKENSLNIELKKYNKLIKEFEEQRKKTVNIFKVLNLEKYEIRHSGMLAWLLNPNENHGFVSRFIADFLKLSCDFVFDVENYDDINVYTEYPVRIIVDGEPVKGRMDIFITGPNFTCTIENKYGSVIHDDQCQTYRTWVNKHYSEKNNLFVYLDLFIPDDFDSVKDYKGYKAIDYEKVLSILNSILEREDIILDDKTIRILEDYRDVVFEKLNPQEIISGLINEEDITIEFLEFINDVDATSESFEMLDLPSKNFILLLKDYLLYKREKCNKGVDKILKGILQDKKLSAKDTIVSGKPVHSYANYGLSIDLNYDGSIYNDYLKTIDIPCLTSINIALISGLALEKSKKLLAFLLNNKDSFFSATNNMKTKGWDIRFYLTLYTAAGGRRADSSTIAKVECNVDKNNISELSKILLDDTKIHRYRFYTNNRMKELFDTIESLKKVKNLFVNVDEFIKTLKEKEKMTSEENKEKYFLKLKNAKEKGKEFPGINNEKGYVYLGGDLMLSMNMTYKSDFSSVDEENLDEIKTIIREKTVEGMNAFGYDSFENDMFI